MGELWFTLQPSVLPEGQKTNCTFEVQNLTNDPIFDLRVTLSALDDQLLILKGRRLDFDLIPPQSSKCSEIIVQGQKAGTVELIVEKIAGKYQRHIKNFANQRICVEVEPKTTIAKAQEISKETLKRRNLPLPHKPRIPKYLDCWIAIRTKSPGYEVTIRNNENQEFTATIELNPDDYDIKQLFTRVTSPHIYGEKLFSAVFFDRVIYSTYSSFQQDASRLNKGLRIRLSMDDVRLSNLAWELLFDSDPHQNHFIGLYKKSPIIRSLDLRFPARPIKTKYPLKILGLAITPENLPKLEIEQEKSLIEQTLHGLINDGKVFLKWSSASTWDGFQREVRTGEWNILHYIGHSGLNPNHGGEIYFEEPKPTSAEDFAMPLHDCPSLKLVVLNSCESAGSAIGSNGFSSLAATLVKAGVPAVVAMQGRIMDDHAIFLAYKFYEALVDGLPIEAALSEARQNLKHAFNEDDFYWALPVLFMRSVDGKLFNFSV